jgi:hypothetical protein
MDRVAVTWVAPESQRERLRDAFTEAGIKNAKADPWDVPAELLDEYPDSQFEPFIAIGGIVAAGWLIKRISDVLLEWKRPGGIVVDTRNPENIVIRDAPLAPRASVVLVEQGKTRVVFPPERKDDALTALESLWTR